MLFGPYKDLDPHANVTFLDVHDQPRRERKLTQAIPVHAVIPVSTVSLRQDKPSRAQNLQMMRDSWLPDRKMVHDVAYAHGIAVGSQQIQNSDARGIG